MNDEKAIEQLEEFLVIDDWSAVYMPHLQDAIEYVINRIKVLEERPQGEWIIDGHHIRCNKCNEYICAQDREGCNIPNNYCPNCGTKMSLKGEDI